MEYVIILLFLVFILFLTAIVYKLSMKDVKRVAENKDLDNIVKKLPTNIEICKSILKKLKNTDVKIEEDKNATNCLYIAMTNKILIGNLKESFTRVQTIAHECLHSIQDKRIIKFNFIYSNIYLLYFAVTSVLAIFNKLSQKMMFLVILLLMSYIYYFIRSYLENDAMTKARFLAKEYMEESEVLEKEEIEKIVLEYDKLNNLGIKFVDYNLMAKTIIKVIIFTIICMIR